MRMLLPYYCYIVLQFLEMSTATPSQESTSVAPNRTTTTEKVEEPYNFDGCPHIHSRRFWQAMPPVKTTNLTHPVPGVILHHTYVPGAVFATPKCIQAMKVIQHFHQVIRKWDDIGYNFAICGDDEIYEGRGWNYVGAHAKGHNSKSIGIVFIGDYTKILPTEKMLNKAKHLIKCGVSQHYIHPDYVLKGHKDVGTTSCPGDRLYAEIKTWPHYNSTADNDTLNK